MASKSKATAFFFTAKSDAEATTRMNIRASKLARCKINSIGGEKKIKIPSKNSHLLLYKRSRLILAKIKLIKRKNSMPRAIIELFERFNTSTSLKLIEPYIYVVQPLFEKKPFSPFSL